MEKTFITMHDLSPEARIVYASDSITDVLGYPPADVVGLSCFDYFHPDQLPFAKKVHDRGLHLDRAAVLVYCQIKHKDGSYVDCETIFSVVYDVFVAATSFHVPTSKSQGRALTAPVIRRVFSASENDPRFHMLTHLSTKFRMHSPEAEGSHEPRVALILNRFTRTLSVLYASHASTRIFGISPGELAGKSFFECIDPNCLQDAVDALERAKENDSIAYLRFRWRDPRNGAGSPDPQPLQPPPTSLRRSTRISAKRKADDQHDAGEGSSQARPAKRRGAIPRENANSRNGTLPNPPTRASADSPANAEPPTEVEAVVSCTSDGLVVILRAARPLIPKPLHNVPGGIFASPWAPNPLVPSLVSSPDKARESSFMEAIREVAVFAWSLRELGGEVVVADGEQPPADKDNKLETGGGGLPIANGKVDGVGAKSAGDERVSPKKSKSGVTKTESSPSDPKRDGKGEEAKTPRGRRKQGRR